MKVINKKKGNKYYIEGNDVKIELCKRNGEIVYTYIELQDLDLVLTNFKYTWCAHLHDSHPTPYVEATVHLGYDENGKWRSKTERMNMLIMNPEHNPNIFVDHIDGDTLNNRRSNLRATVPQKNSINRKSRNSNNKSGYRNVACISNSKYPYHVQLSINGKNTCLGKFYDVDEAGAFAEEMRRKYYKDFAGSN